MLFFWLLLGITGVFTVGGGALESARIAKERKEARYGEYYINKRREEEEKEEKLKQEKLEQEKLEKQKLEQEKLKQEKLEQQKLEQQKSEQQKSEQQKLEQQKLEQQKSEQQKLEQQKSDQQKLEQQKSDQQQLEQQKKDKQIIEDKQQELRQQELKQKELRLQELRQQELKQKELKKKDTPDLKDIPTQTADSIITETTVVDPQVLKTKVVNQTDVIIEEKKVETSPKIISLNITTKESTLEEVARQNFIENVKELKKIVLDYRKELFNSEIAKSRRILELDKTLFALNQALEKGSSEVEQFNINLLFNDFLNLDEEKAQQFYETLNNQKEKASKVDSKVKFTNLNNHQMSLAAAIVFKNNQKVQLFDIDMDKNKKVPVQQKEIVTSRIDNIKLIRKTTNEMMKNLDSYKFALMTNPSNSDNRFITINNLVQYLNKVNKRLITANDLSVITKFATEYSKYNVDTLQDHIEKIKSELKTVENNKKFSKLKALEVIILNSFIYSKTNKLAKNDSIPKGVQREVNAATLADIKDKKILYDDFKNSNDYSPSKIVKSPITGRTGKTTIVKKRKENTNLTNRTGSVFKNGELKMKLNSLSNEDQTIINTDSENIIKKQN